MTAKNDNISIRRATPDDALGIKQAHVCAYQHSYRGYIPDEYLDAMKIDEEGLERTRRYITENECYIAVNKDKIAGFAYLSDHEDCFEINALYVHPDHQKQGVGSLLVDTICPRKQQQGYTKCILWTMKFGPSLKFYDKKGFHLTDKEKVWKFNIAIIMLEKELKVNSSLS